jgi:hypothetical protein
MLTASQAAGAITQPPQPRSGPGGGDYRHAGWRVSSGGGGADGWYVFEPVGPRPVGAPLAIVLHGYYEFSGYDQLYVLIRHTVRRGSVVVYPRWQAAAAQGQLLRLFVRRHHHGQPREQVSVAASAQAEGDLARRSARRRADRFRRAGAGRLAVGHPVVGEAGVPLRCRRGDRRAGQGERQLQTADAYDWNFCWEVWDALRSCAHHGTDCRYALGNTRQHRSNGSWSDDVPITPLKIQDAAPIRP